jgi:hypothetical protein
MTSIQVYYSSALSAIHSISLNTTTTFMLSDRKQTTPLYIPHFTAANYGSFFLAGQRCTRLVVIQGLSDLIPKGHYVRRMFVSQSEETVARLY